MTSYGINDNEKSAFAGCSPLRPDTKIRHVEIVARLVERIHQQPGFFQRRGDIAFEALMSPAHFTRVFKSVTGQTPQNHLTEAKKQHSCELLGNPNLRIKQISARCGFVNQNHFSAWFKKQTGQSPSQFRAALRRI
ncbi:MAG TPA: hypothetical protein DCZ95_12195 [Verrucomicrobia bacterium]|nr:MAG: hypothetical protein A2X46_14245 [Lentisphaerae bacterium GWF2_57_35]HBA84846.1 hypothetical protein [Verrucomicrobiota bacterium]